MNSKVTGKVKSNEIALAKKNNVFYKIKEQKMNYQKENDTETSVVTLISWEDNSILINQLKINKIPGKAENNNLHNNYI